MKKIKSKQKVMTVNDLALIIEHSFATKDEFERSNVLLEDMNSKFDFLAEGVTELMKLPPIVQKLSEDMEIVKTDIDIMKGLLKRKVDVEEFEALVKRVSNLENKRQLV